jgi:divalent metal cation (Fe/Co/Zn/Cd) transporter
MKPAAAFELPDELKPILRQGIVLEIWTLVYQLSITLIMFAVMGTSQAMKTAWIEDMLGLIPPAAFLISNRLRHREPDVKHPYGWHRAVSIAFLAASLALMSLGGFLFVDSSINLISAERATVGTFKIFGHLVWQGWFMIAALLYGTFPIMYLGYRKLEPARQLHDKTLYTDATINKAGWLTTIAAMVGVAGIGMGAWWLDPLAALIISLDILHDGVKSLRSVLGDLMDREPETVDHAQTDCLPERIVEALRQLHWVHDARVRLREEGHVFFGEAFIVPKDEHDPIARTEESVRLAYSLDWRLNDLVVQLVRRPEEHDPQSGDDEASAQSNRVIGD